MPERGRVLVEGAARGRLLVLGEPLSLWGGLDPKSGRIVDPRHPEFGRNVSGRVLALPAGKGSSSASSILLEAVRCATAPAAILLRESDGILALGAAVARELYGKHPPVLLVGREVYERLVDGAAVEVTRCGEIRSIDASSAVSPTDRPE